MNEYQVPKHIVAVSAYVRNDEGEVLLVKTHGRSDTWELPGGQVEQGEPPHEAVSRELFEETGINAKPIGITGVYYNTQTVRRESFKPHIHRQSIRWR